MNSRFTTTINVLCKCVCVCIYSSVLTVDVFARWERTGTTQEIKQEIILEIKMMFFFCIPTLSLLSCRSRSWIEFCCDEIVINKYILWMADWHVYANLYFIHQKKNEIIKNSVFCVVYKKPFHHCCQSIYQSNFQWFQLEPYRLTFKCLFTLTNANCQSKN